MQALNQQKLQMMAGLQSMGDFPVDVQQISSAQGETANDMRN